MGVRRGLLTLGIFAAIVASAAFPTTEEAALSAACPPPSSPIAFGATVQCSIAAPAEQDTFTFTGQGGDRVYLRVVDLSDNAFQPKIELSGPSGLICSVNGSLLAEADCTLSDAGTNSYNVIVSDFFGVTTATYGIYVQRTNAPTSATTIGLGDTLSGAISSQPEMDAYTFTSSGGDRVLLRFVDLVAGEFRPEIRLYGPTGLICSNSGSVLAQVDCVLSGAGTNSYALLVGDFSGSATGSYGVHIQKTNTPPIATSISPGQTIAGRIAAIPATKAHTFTGLAGTMATVTMIAPLPGSFRPEIRLYGPAGLICLANGTTTAQATCALSGTGTNAYTIIVEDFFGASPGYFCVSLNVSSPVCADADSDGVPDDLDNCPATTNADQLNTDAANTAVNRPGADSLGDACDNDIDGDGYTNTQETTSPLAEHPLVYCNIMRADVDGDHIVSILDLADVAQYFTKGIPPAPERYKQDADNSISILDFADMGSHYAQNVSACP
jgi:hypothetical protein